MSEEKYQIKYIGKEQIAFAAIGFTGIVNTGDIILLGKQSFEELKTHADWEAVAKDKRGKSEKEVIAPDTK